MSLPVPGTWSHLVMEKPNPNPLREHAWARIFPGRGTVKGQVRVLARQPQQKSQCVVVLGPEEQGHTRWSRQQGQPAGGSSQQQPQQAGDTEESGPQKDIALGSFPRATVFP